MAVSDPFEELIPMYALGGLTPAERRQIQAHLQECANCRKRLQEEQAIVQMLLRAIEPVEPSPQTKARLFARIEADLAQTGAPARPAIVTRTPASKARRAWFSQPVFAFAVLAALVVLALGAWLFVQTIQSPEQRAIAAILNDPNVKKVTLPGTKDAPGASAEIYMVPGQSQAVLRVTGLSQLPQDKGYEFWFIKGQEPPQPSNVFTVNPDGTMTVLVKAKDQVQNFNAWAVSIEPRTGVPQPTGTIVILGGL